MIGLCCLAPAPARGSGAAEQGAEDDSRRPSVLFIGNSYTRFNVLPLLFGRLGRPADDAPPLATRSMAKGGYTLRMHWRRPETRELLRAGEFTHVVLQGHSLRPLDRPAEFEEYLTRFVQEAREAGSEPVLYQTWARKPGHWFYAKRPELAGAEQMSGRVAEAYERLGRRLGARVAPVGRAFLLASRRRPDIPLYKRDGMHPSWAGSYLAACVLYGTVTGRDPEAAGYAPWELRPDHAEALRQLAAAILSGAP